MAILTLSLPTESGDALGWILSKNPATIQASGKPFERDLAKGRVFGWFKDPQTWACWFKDSPVDASFGAHGEFEYLDLGRYAHPKVYLGMLRQVFASATKALNEKDVHPAALKVQMSIPRRAARVQMQGLELTPAASGIYDVTLTSPNVYTALNTLEALATIAALYDDSTYTQMKKENVAKMLTTLARVNAPFLAWHLFLQVSGMPPSLFNVFVEEGLIPQDPATLKLAYGNSQAQRHDFIKAAVLSFAKDSQGQPFVGGVLYDMGCGEAYHSARLAHLFDGVAAVDIDEHALQSAAKTFTRRGVENAAVLLGDFLQMNEDLTIGDSVTLLAEVLEHLEKPVASTFLRTLLERSPAGVILTLPNYAFNPHYGIWDGESRHPEHFWEPTKAQADQFLAESMPEGWVAAYTPIGSVAQGEPISHGYVLTKPASDPTFTL